MQNSSTQMLVFLGTLISIAVAWRRPMHSKSNDISSQKNGWSWEVMSSKLTRCMGNSPRERERERERGGGKQLEKYLIL